MHQTYVCECVLRRTQLNRIQFNPQRNEWQRWRRRPNQDQDVIACDLDHFDCSDYRFPIAKHATSALRKFDFYPCLSKQIIICYRTTEQRDWSFFPISYDKQQQKREAKEIKSLYDRNGKIAKQNPPEACLATATDRVCLKAYLFSLKLRVCLFVSSLLAKCGRIESNKPANSIDNDSKKKTLMCIFFLSMPVTVPAPCVRCRFVSYSVICFIGTSVLSYVCVCIFIFNDIFSRFFPLSAFSVHVLCLFFHILPLRYLAFSPSLMLSHYLCSFVSHSLALSLVIVYCCLTHYIVNSTALRLHWNLFYRSYSL